MEMIVGVKINATVTCRLRPIGNAVSAKER
jgi:hypothetical protein